MTSMKKALSPILESMGPEVVSPNLSDPSKSVYRIFNEIKKDYDTMNEKEYQILKTTHPEHAKKAEKVKRSEHPKEQPGDIFGEETIVEEISVEANTPEKESILQKKFEEIVVAYFVSEPHIKKDNKVSELEVRFGTRGIKPLTKNDYDNVIKKLKSIGFMSNDENGINRLTIKNEFQDKNTGTFKISNIRTEILGINQIQNYCKTNDVNELIKKGFHGLSFVKKDYVRDSSGKPFVVNFDNFNFRVAYESEEAYMSRSGKNSFGFIVQNWKNSKKTFRYINRVTFTHALYPINVDISITKSSDYGGKYYTLEESNIFEKNEVYEIELEVDNSRVGPGTKFNDPKQLLDSIRKVIKFVLSGLQGTNYPVSYSEQKQVMENYMSMIYKDQFNPSKHIRNSNFIGPNSYTLQMVNIAPIDENSIAPNIRADFVVTEKADGERHLMFIDNNGKIYLIGTNMNVIFTGAKTFNDDTFNTLIDGELILHDKNKQYLNLFAAFDIYYMNKMDVRSLPFIPLKNEKSIDKSRYLLLKKVINDLNPVSIMEKTLPKGKNVKTIVKGFDKMDKLISPIKITFKKFLPESQDGNIFSACFDILSNDKKGLFEYNTDGLIFTHAYFGVGGDAIGKVGPLSKITWAYSFKWKPPQYNTIDFLVDTVKTQSGDDIIKQTFEPGTNVLLSEQSSNYKTIQLKCTFIESEHGFINPCQDIIDDNLPEYKSVDEKNYKDPKPVQFVPTSPYDADAGLCKIMLRKDDNNTYQMFTEEEDIFTDGMIVEFSYDTRREKGWKWVPLRVRYDKTTDMRQNKRNFGNAYHVANSNWQSIHNPITEDMICTGSNIPDVIVDEDIYYNKSVGSLKTVALKDFHNLYVKKNLIKSVSNTGDTLIDYACGRAGDLPKWVASRLSFVFGIDKSNENLGNRLDGACARFLKMKKTTKIMPSVLFVNGNSAFNIKNGSALLNDKAIQITKTVFGTGSSSSEKVGKGVAKQFGKAKDGFNISSCQFALHYFLESAETLQGFMRNLAECTKLGGYFIGTAYDGKTLFNLLSKKARGESIQIVEDEKKIWEVVKMYNADTFEDNSSSINYRIDVYQESINQMISEYLINFDYLDRVLENYGFKLISRDEAKSFGLPEATGLFSELFMNMLEEIKKNKNKEKDYGKAIEMTEMEKKISFLNRYFVYKKVIMVNAENVELELGEYNEMDVEQNAIDSSKAVEIAKQEEVKIKPHVKKLNKKLLLINATEATEYVEEPTIAHVPVPTPQKKEKKKTVKEPKPTKEPKTTKEPKPTKLKKQVKIVEDIDIVDEED
jgi:hypothetical protein